MIPGILRLQCDAAMTGGKFDRVVHQIDHHLLNAVTVRPHKAGIQKEVAFHFHFHRFQIIDTPDNRPAKHLADIKIRNQVDIMIEREFKQWTSLALRFGLTPTERTRLAVSPHEEEDEIFKIIEGKE